MIPIPCTCECVRYFSHAILRITTRIKVSKAKWREMKEIKICKNLQDREFDQRRTEMKLKKCAYHEAS